ncbi:MAG: chaperone NapD [Caldimicrobium sp.]|nr:chaperone NapD [Caldimicrobium sp.]MCX7873184.1 chaperone NapD [Caldimicrobium sp.]MDW8094237.1 hypothetical protein [Caldimicrobium sp.]
MPIASGFLEVLDNEGLERVIDILKANAIEVIGVENKKIVYLIERESLFEIESTLKFMKGIEGVLNVFLTYYSLGKAGD